jgi:hypothetical protein
MNVVDLIGAEISEDEITADRLWGGDVPLIRASHGTAEPVPPPDPPAPVCPENYCTACFAQGVSKLSSGIRSSTLCPEHLDRSKRARQLQTSYKKFDKDLRAKKGRIATQWELSTEPGSYSGSYAAKALNICPVCGAPTEYLIATVCAAQDASGIFGVREDWFGACHVHKEPAALLEREQEVSGFRVIAKEPNKPSWLSVSLSLEVAP